VAETQTTNGVEVLETREWLDSLDYVLSQGGPERAGRLLQQLSLHARRAPVEAYAAAHSKETNGALARLALGVTAFEQGDYAEAIPHLRMLPAKLPQIADYAACYLGAARVESNDLSGVGQDLAPLHRVVSPLSGKAWLLEARALKATSASEAVHLLREHYAELPQGPAQACRSAVEQCLSEFGALGRPRQCRRTSSDAAHGIHDRR